MAHHKNLLQQDNTRIQTRGYDPIRLRPPGDLVRFIPQWLL